MPEKPSPYLLRVNSRPSRPDIGDDLWTEFCTKERLPDLVKSGVATRAAFYRELHNFPPLSGVRPPKDEAEKSRNFLAMCQSNHQTPIDTEEYRNLRLDSDLLPEGEVKSMGDYDARNFKLIQNFDPKGVGVQPGKYLLTVEMSPADESTYHMFYEDEHLPLLTKVPGYRRTLRYEMGPRDPILTPKRDLPGFFVGHEYDSLDGLAGEEMDAAMSTDLAKTVRMNSMAVIWRCWELIEGVGFGS
ncbi:hypothetical protein BDY21DRAFT_55168 [Lineolata rhizophorae]|uniref:EthD domain-containing protein n=1 Tax=Lineolata rhizophorae TaxID=578093 RepID=A0A6A6NXR4_9PEZI|nr:hypothetical protein BDY21DRAFT_55168 [Lineolata rhizophorae]